MRVANGAVTLSGRAMRTGDGAITLSGRVMRVADGAETLTGRAFIQYIIAYVKNRSNQQMYFHGRFVTLG